MNRTQFREYIAMLEDVQQRIQTLIDQGLTEEQVVAAKPLADLDTTWSWFFVNGDFFTTLVYRDLHKDPR